MTSGFRNWGLSATVRLDGYDLRGPAGPLAGSGAGRLERCGYGQDALDSGRCLPSGSLPLGSLPGGHGDALAPAGRHSGR